MLQVTKAVRFQIIKPLNFSWDEFGRILNDLSYHTTLMCNAAVQMYWEHNVMRNRYKAEHGRYPQDKEIYGQSFRNVVYHRLREMYPLMASSNVSQTNQFALKRWQTDLREVMRLQKSVPSFRLGTPVQVANQNYSLYIAKGEPPEYCAEITLLGKDAACRRFTVLLDAGDAPKKAVFRRIVEGKYKQGVMQIIKHPRKKKWFCIVSYTITKDPAPGLDQERVMGVNLATGEAVYWAFSFSPKRGSIPAGEIEAAEKKIRAITARRREMQRTAGVTGHGRKRRLKATRVLAGKTANIRDAINHKYSRRIVRIAAANRCGKIRLADMSALGMSGALKAWPWSDLVQKIGYKAAEQGIDVEIVEKPGDRAKAWHTCSECGYSAPENVGDNTEFLACKECGARISLEYNAALNIAVLARDSIPEQQTSAS
ncbi:putative transposase DNA-binding domain protein [Thermincola ferriacetica]|uniref:Putative transposase DNA-binding domain protein n=1 Tax=Thermincola ferriacetica TaxID=281456 RepID=A0A0L6VZP6_9FIRM|nr:RNA-guided endonuclease TnpB family protein [Thermincola ferriacetica]KNZ68681.1 putative transposase DNA-binding domain protein [Thermincola ferriacetica]